MPNNHQIAVLGGGSFGTAIANMLADNNYPVTLWVRNTEAASAMRETRENARYLPGYSLNPALTISDSLAEALRGADTVFFVVPSKAFRELARQVRQFLTPQAMVISAAKGIEGESFKLMSQVLSEELPGFRIGVLSGPNLAREIIAEEITATVIASDAPELCETVQELLGSRYFRVYANSDRFGVELAGALKNIYAISAGMAAALNVGMNTTSVLITRSLAEMSRFATRMGANPLTFLGLAGVGDLFVSCTSPLSRNYRVGQALAQGIDIETAVRDIGQVAEGVNTTRIVKEKADELGIYMPLATALYDVMYQQKPIRQAIAEMMLAEQSKDVEFSVNKAFSPNGVSNDG